MKRVIADGGDATDWTPLFSRGLLDTISNALCDIYGIPRASPLSYSSRSAFKPVLEARHQRLQDIHEFYTAALLYHEPQGAQEQLRLLRLEGRRLPWSRCEAKGTCVTLPEGQEMMACSRVSTFVHVLALALAC